MTRCSSLRIILPVLCIIFFSRKDDAKTRWSSLHQIPDADFIESNRFVLDLQGCNIVDSAEGIVFIPYGIVNIGLNDWVNVEAGYAGGFTMGIKAAILSEKGDYIPSVALGFHDIFSHKEAHLSDHKADTLNSELYLVLGKSLENIKLRFHLGIQTMVHNHNEVFNPFLGFEKYFGNGFYVTMESFRLDKRFHFSMYASYRFLKNRMEIFAGIADFDEILRDRRYSIISTEKRSFTRPGIRIGLRFRERFGFGKNSGIRGLEDRICYQNEIISKLRKEVDSLKVAQQNQKTGKKVCDSLETTKQPQITEEDKLKIFAVQKLSELKTIFSEEPFEPQKVKAVRKELVSKKDQILPVLHEIALDIKKESRIRLLAISSLGESGYGTAADMLIDILAQVNIPELKIETLIALGKLNEVRAVSIIQEFLDDPDDAVAFVASEVLQKIQKETGIFLEPVETVPDVIPEQKIGTKGDNFDESDKIPVYDKKNDSGAEKKPAIDMYLPDPQDYLE